MRFGGIAAVCLVLWLALAGFSFVTPPWDWESMSGNYTIEVSFDGTYDVFLDLETLNGTVRLDSTSNVTDTYAYVWDTSAFPDGYGYNLTVTISDENGSANRAVSWLGPDNTAPNVSIITPADGSVIVSGEQVGFVGTAVDVTNPGATCVLVVRSGLEIVSNQTAFAYPSFVYSVDLEEGIYDWSIACEDYPQNVAVVERTLYIGDASTPLPLENLSVPLVVLRSDANITLSVDASGLDPNVSLASDADGGFSIELNGSSTFTYEGSIEPFDCEDPCTLYVLASDAVGRKNSTSFTLSIDDDEPALEVSGPLNGSYARELEVSWNVSDASNVTVQLVVNGSVVANTSPVSFEPSEGRVEWFVRATDAAGNNATIARMLTIDRTPPSIDFDTITAPRTIDVSGTVSEPSNVTVTVDGAVELGWVSSFDVSFDGLRANTEYDVTVRACDHVSCTTEVESVRTLPVQSSSNREPEVTVVELGSSERLRIGLMDSVLFSIDGDVFALRYRGSDRFELDGDAIELTYVFEADEGIVTLELFGADLSEARVDASYDPFPSVAIASDAPSEPREIVEPEPDVPLEPTLQVARESQEPEPANRITGQVTGEPGDGGIAVALMIIGSFAVAGVLVFFFLRPS